MSKIYDEEYQGEVKWHEGYSGELILASAIRHLTCGGLGISDACIGRDHALRDLCLPLLDFFMPTLNWLEMWRHDKIETRRCLRTLLCLADAGAIDLEDAKEVK